MLYPTILFLAIASFAILLGLLILSLFLRPSKALNPHLSTALAQEDEPLDRQLDALDAIPNVSTRLFILLAMPPLSPTRAAALALALRQLTWINKAIRPSRLTPLRIRSTRLLSIVAQPQDEEVVLSAMADESPLVQLAAVSTIRHLPTSNLIDAAIHSFPSAPPLVRSHIRSVLNLWPELVIPKLITFLNSPPTSPDPKPLISCLDISHLFVHSSPALLSIVLPFTNHIYSEVRLAAFKAVQSPSVAPSLDVQDVFVQGLVDHDWRVRAQSAKGLGQIASPMSVPGLALNLSDEEWWVRHRSALALANSGPSGRRALEEIANIQDHYASDQANYALSLTPESLALMVND